MKVAYVEKSRFDHWGNYQKEFVGLYPSDKENLEALKKVIKAKNERTAKAHRGFKYEYRLVSVKQVPDTF